VLARAAGQMPRGDAELRRPCGMEWAGPPLVTG